jgi:hypothetical protein
MTNVTEDTNCYCVHCDEDMERAGDGYFDDVLQYILFHCPKCGCEIMVR